MGIHVAWCDIVIAGHSATSSHNGESPVSGYRYSPLPFWGPRSRGIGLPHQATNRVVGVHRVGREILGPLWYAAWGEPVVQAAGGKDVPVEPGVPEDRPGNRGRACS